MNFLETASFRISNIGFNEGNIFFHNRQGYECHCFNFFSSDKIEILNVILKRVFW